MHIAQEFPLPDAIRAWDALLADPAGPRDALVRIAAAMVLHLRAPLLAGDFAANVKLLQSYPPADGAPTAQACCKCREAKCFRLRAHAPLVLPSE
jgi:hypothetical protein